MPADHMRDLIAWASELQGVDDGLLITRSFDPKVKSIRLAIIAAALQLKVPGGRIREKMDCTSDFLCEAFVRLKKDADARRIMDDLLARQKLSSAPVIATHRNITSEQIEQAVAEQYGVQWSKIALPFPGDALHTGRLTRARLTAVLFLHDVLGMAFDGIERKYFWHNAETMHEEALEGLRNTQNHRSEIRGVCEKLRMKPLDTWETS